MLSIKYILTIFEIPNPLFPENFSNQFFNGKAKLFFFSDSHYSTRVGRSLRLLLSKLPSICNYILFTKLPWPGGSEGPFGLRVKLPPVYHTRLRLHIVRLIAERQARKL